MVKRETWRRKMKYLFGNVLRSLHHFLSLKKLLDSDGNVKSHKSI